MISLPILLLVVIASTHVTGEENGRPQRTMYSNRNGKSYEHPKMLAMQIKNKDDRILENTGTHKSFTQTENHSANYQQQPLNDEIKNTLPVANQTRINHNSKPIQETHNNQKASSVGKTKSASENINPTRVADAVKMTLDSKIGMKQSPKSETYNEKAEGYDYLLIGGKKPGQENETDVLIVSPDIYESGTNSTEDDRISGTVLTSLGGAPGR